MGGNILISKKVGGAKADKFLARVIPSAFKNILPLEESKLAGLCKYPSITPYLSAAIEKAIAEGKVTLNLGNGNGILVYNPIDFKKIKVLIFDYNNTLALDAVYQWQINIVVLEHAIRHGIFALDNGLCELVESGALKRFFYSVAQWNGMGCLYKRGRLCFENGWIFCPKTNMLFTQDGQVLKPNGEVHELISKSLFVPTYDFMVAVRALLLRRNVGIKEAEKSYIEGMKKVYGKKEILHRGFNEWLPTLFKRCKNKSFYIVSNNKEPIILEAATNNQLHVSIPTSNIIGGAEKYFRFPEIIADICIKEKVEPHEILVIGDSMHSDIEPAKRVDGVKTIHIRLGKGAKYNGIVPDISVNTLNEAIRYLLSTDNR